MYSSAPLSIVTHGVPPARTEGRVPRSWTAEEANARLPAIQEMLPQLRGWVVRLGAIHDQTEWMAKFWGRELKASDNPHHALQVTLDEEWTRLTDRLESIVRALHDEGIEIKDLDNGLVDFITQRDGEAVYLCWRDGEAAVTHWHPLDGGFRNRRRLDAPTRAGTPPHLTGSN